MPRSMSWNRRWRADRGGVQNGDVARWREHARQSLSEGEPAADEPLATFVVEAREPATDPAGNPASPSITSRPMRIHTPSRRQ